MKTINTSKKRYWMALATALTLAGAALPTYAGEGHDHGAAPATANANGPQRMADGSVFLPKPAQRQLNVRTMVVETAELPRAFELNGQVRPQQQRSTGRARFWRDCLGACRGRPSGGHAGFDF